MKEISLLFLFAFIFSSTFVISQGLGPGVPHQFYGDAIYNNGVDDGIEVAVYIEGTKVGSTTASEGVYGYSPIFFIKDPDGAYEGRTITFYLNNVDTGITYIFENGASTKLNLSASGPEPTTPPSDTNTGGGGGGSSGGGGGGSTPPKIIVASDDKTRTQTQDTETEDKDDSGLGILETETEEGFFSGITGAVIGAFGKTGTVAFVFVIGVVAVALIVFAVRKRKAIAH